jgi:hypothetical protein
MSNKKKRKTQAENTSEQTISEGVKTSEKSRPYDFNPDYTYVRKDLREIGILAGIFITILVVLSFFI